MKYFITTLLLFLFTSCSTSNPIPLEEKTYSSYIDKKYLNQLDFKGEEIIAIFTNNAFYYVRKDGKAMKALTYHNAADPFVEGLARTKVNGKIGFFNTNLDMVLKPIYDFAFPFYKGIAEICTGCKEQKVGDYSMLKGGKWQKINREGLVIE
jgi:hypothetical protein